MEQEGKKMGRSIGEEMSEEDELPGFRFHPTDEELVGFYLRRKVIGKPLSMEIIKQIDIYKYDPWDLPRLSIGAAEKEWYFFCQRGRKYRNSVRPNRVTGSGFWKATGIDRPIYSSSGSGSCIGLKKSLVYYMGSAGKGTKTDWMMHEFRHPPKNEADFATGTGSQEAEIWTVCRIFRRIAPAKKYNMMQAPKQPSAIDQRLLEESCSMDSGIDYENNRYLAPPLVYKQEETGPPLQMIGPPGDYRCSARPVSTGTVVASLLEDVSWEELGKMVDCTPLEFGGVY